MYKNIVKAVCPDLIITYTIKSNLYGGLISRLMNIEYVMNITGLGKAFQKKGFLRSFVVAL